MNVLLVAASLLGVLDYDLLNTMPLDPLRVNTDCPVILLWYTADHCLACREQIPLLHYLSRNGYPICTVNVADVKWQSMIRRLPYTKLPHWIMVRDGRAWQIRRGGLGQATVCQWFREAGYRVSKSSR